MATNYSKAFGRRLLLLALLFCSGLGLAQVTDSTVIDRKRQDSLNDSFNIPVFSTSGDDAESDIDQQDVSSLLQSSRDVFTQFSSFQFSSGRYRMRGYPAENEQVMINGVSINNLETGSSSWSSWGGLNDVTRFVENRFGNVSNRYGYSGPGGYTNIDSKASSFRKGTRISYANGNRIFRNRLMVTHSTGMMQNGWALTLSASTRQGNQVYIPGTFFNANSFYASIDKQVNYRHSFNFTAFDAPIEQGRSSAEQLEAYQLAGSNYYNALWGYQNGKVRNSSVSKVNRPMMMLSHTYQMRHDARLATTAYYTFGKSSLSGIDWNNAPYPKPDYYYYLPSYYYNKGDVATGNQYAQNWMNDVNTRQIDWDKLIAINQANLYTLPSQLGQGLNTTETRSRYILGDRVEDLKNAGVNSVYNQRFGKLFLSAGFNANLYRNRKYKVVEDLLGGSYWLDYDQFAQNLGVDPMVQQNNLDQPDKKIHVGDKYGYDYSINIDHAQAWSQAEYSFGRLDVYAGASLADSRVWREGYVANGKFPTDSKGLSDKLNFFNYGVKAGATYKLSGRHFFTVNGNIMTRPPETNNMFLSPTTRNQYVSGLQNEQVISGDVNYHANFPGFKLRLTYYYTQINNQVWLRTYYNEIYNTNVNLIMKNLDQNHQGIELGLEKTLFTVHVIQAAFSTGQFLYTNRPTLEAWQNNTSTPLFQNRTAYLKNYRIGGTPQTVIGLGYKYEARQHWFVGLYFNYFDDIYIEPNPDRRTAEAVSNYLSNETDQYQKVIKQQKLPGYYTINANAGKSFRIRQSYLNVNVSVNNILNNKTNITSGFEQLRWDNTNLDKFANKYYYMQGITYMATLNLTF